MGLLPESQLDEILAKSKSGVQFAADALQKSIVSGLLKNYSNLDIINLPYLLPWPKCYSEIQSPDSFRETHCNNGTERYTLENWQFLNIPVIRFIDRYRITRRALYQYCKKNENEEIFVLIYAISTPFIKAAVDVKKSFPNLKIIQIAPDLPQYMSENDGALRSALKKMNQKLLRSLYRKTDGFVILTKCMAEQLVTDNQPYTVMEGIYNPADDKFSDSIVSTEIKRIVYTGTLARRYNIMDLIESVQNLERNDFVLEIYGDGDTKQEIIDISRKDPRIKYCGILSRNEILKVQRQAFLLVNPRKGHEEFTKFSFPSKTMEYLASGTPTLINRMKGIPDEYYEYCFCCDDDNNASFAKKIEQILDMDWTQLRQFGDTARNFVLTRKNPVVQTQKIANLITTLSNIETINN